MATFLASFALFATFGVFVSTLLALGGVLEGFFAVLVVCLVAFIALFATVFAVFAFSVLLLAVVLLAFVALVAAFTALLTALVFAVAFAARLLFATGVVFALLPGDLGFNFVDFG